MVNNFQDKANFIWQVADDILRGAFKGKLLIDLLENQLDEEKILAFPGIV